MKEEAKTTPDTRYSYGIPCPHCLELCMSGDMDREAIQPLQGGSLDSLAIDRRPQCQDCAFAGTLVKMKIVPTWEMARVAVENFRRESLRLPGVPRDLAFVGARISQAGELQKHWRWLDKYVPKSEGE